MMDLANLEEEALRPLQNLETLALKVKIREHDYIAHLDATVGLKVIADFAREAVEEALAQLKEVAK